jgi:PhnB protein
MTMTAPNETAQVAPIPEGFHTVTPTLIIGGAADAIEFYIRAFGAQELERASGPDGTRIMHATIQIGDSRMMIADEFPAFGARGPKTLGGSPISMHLYVEDADAIFAQAVEAGATVSMPIQDVFWGDRYGRVTDPFGYEWAVATRKRIATDEDIQAAMQAMSEGGCAEG